MSTRLVSNLDDEVAGLLQGTNLDNVTNKYGAYARSVRTMAQRAYLPEAIDRRAVTLYDGVYDYAAPDTIFGSSLVDFRPQGLSRTPADYPYKIPIAQFDRTKCSLSSGYNITFEYVGGVPRMRIAQTKAQKAITLDPMSSITGWVAGGLASTPVLDTTVYYNNSSSLRSSISGAGSGYLEKTFNAVDLTSYRGVGVVFLALYVPTVANLSSIELRLGSSSANYYSLSVTQGFLGAWRDGDFLLVAFDLASAATIGTPVITAMTYTRLTLTTAGALSNVRFGSLFIALPSPHDLLFKTAAIFSHNSTLSSEITDSNDQIMLTDPTYNIFIHECAKTIALQNGGTSANGVVAELDRILFGVRARTGAVVQLGLYDLYRADNPSEELRSTGNWYND